MAILRVIRMALMCILVAFTSVAGLIHLYITPVAAGLAVTVEIEQPEPKKVEPRTFDNNLRDQAIERLQNTLGGEMRKSVSQGAQGTPRANFELRREAPNSEKTAPKRLPRIV